MQGVLVLLCSAASLLWGQVKSQELWAPIRIAPVYDPSLSRYDLDTQRLIKNALVPGVLQWFSEAVQVRRTRSSILLMRDCSTGIQFLRDRRYCQASCAPATMCGPVLIPDEHLQPCSRCEWSGLNCETDFNQPAGVNKSDFVLYVSALSDKCNDDQYLGQIAYGGHCQQESQYDRPIAGFLNFCPALLLDGSSFDRKIGLVLHELVHTLVFSKQLFSYYRDEQGLPRTQRSRNGKPLIVNGDYDISASTIRQVEGQTDGPSVTAFIVTPKVMKAAIEHFNCSSLIGAQLENGNEPHWEKRFFGNEIMTGSLSDFYVISKVTMALFEDSGWYRVDYRYTHFLDWGRNKGCSFVTSSCRDWLNKDALDPYPFCTLSDWQDNHHHCVNSWTSVGDCSIKNYTAPLPNGYQVLPPNLRGTDSLADYCPIYKFDSKNTIGKSCKLQPPGARTSSNIGMESFGPNSICVTLSKRWRVVSSQGTVNQSDWGAGCYEFKCTSTQVLITIGSLVIRCDPHVTKEISMTNRGTTLLGAVVCPAYEDVCAGFNCYNMCSGNGQCSNGYCLCNPGYFGYDCSRRYLEGKQLCSDIQCQNGGSCQDTPLGTRCLCLPGFTGMMCEVAMPTDPCAQQPCGGRGLCYRTNGGQSAECHCYHGYSGAYCQDVVDFCAAVNIKCAHGQCTNDSYNPSCICLPGYSGLLCDQLTDPCALKPCKNGGLCINTSSVGQYQCRCPMGFRGKICKMLDTPCPSNVCPNSSRCYIAGTNHSVCACVEPTCDAMWNEQCPLSMCRNGGRCVWNGVSNQCLCPVGATGEACTQNATKIPSFLGNGYVIVPTVTDSTSGHYVITISLKPDSDNGQILYWEGPTTFLSLSLQGLSLVYRIGSTNASELDELMNMTDSMSLLPGRWHSISLEWTAASCALHVTTGKATRSVSCPSGTHTTPLSLGSRLFVGGRNNSSETPQGFVGCVSHIEVNGLPLNMTAGEAWSHNVFQCEAAGPCGGCEGVCRSSPTEGYWCECGSSKAGAMCDRALPSTLAFNHSYVLMPLATQLLTNITVTITSHTTSGLLLLITSTPTTSDNFLSVSLNNSNITVATNLAFGRKWSVTLPRTVAMDVTQRIRMVFKSGVLTKVNSVLIEGIPPSYEVGKSLFVYIGGVSPWQRWSQWEWWCGCVQFLTVNGQHVLLSSAIRSMNIMQCN